MQFDQTYEHRRLHILRELENYDYPSDVDIQQHFLKLYGVDLLTRSNGHPTGDFIIVNESKFLLFQIKAGSP